MQKKTIQSGQIFYTAAQIKASFDEYFERQKTIKKSLPAAAGHLDNVGTTGSFTPSLVGVSPGEKLGKNGCKTVFSGISPAAADPWEKQFKRREKVRQQIQEIRSGIEGKEKNSACHYLQQAQAALAGCGKNYLVEKLAKGKFKYLHSFHCKKKYCPRCASEKRNVLLARFQEFFESQPGLDVLQQFDLAVLTVTLKHGKGSRQGWYFKELQSHFRNSLKYGNFQKYIAGGIYSTEITSGKNGFHIHRHALVLIPKEFNFRAGSVGEWKNEGGKWKFNFSKPFIRNEIRKSWAQKTGDSFQVDLVPVNNNYPLLKNLLEVFKYIAKSASVKGSADKKSFAVPSEIVEQMEMNKGQKFLGRFGNLYKEKALALNVKFQPDLQRKTALENIPPGSIFYASGLYKTKKGKFSFRKLFPAAAADYSAALISFRDFNRKSRSRSLLNLCSKSFRRFYGSTDPVPRQISKGHATIQNASAGQCNLFFAGSFTG